MKLTTRSRYGLRAVYYLKQHYNDGPVSLPKMVEDLHLSQNYLEQLFIKLKKSGIIESKRGAYGGYILAKDPSEITVGQIIKSLEGNINFSDDCSTNDKCYAIDCVTRNIFIKIDEAINEIINTITLNDI